MTEGLFTCSDDCRTWYTSLPRTTAGRGWTVRTEVGAKIDAHAERIGFGYMRLLLEAPSSPLVVDAALLVGISKRSMVHDLWEGVSSGNNDEAQHSDKDASQNVSDSDADDDESDSSSSSSSAKKKKKKKKKTKKNNKNNRKQAHTPSSKKREAALKKQRADDMKTKAQDKLEAVLKRKLDEDAK